MISHRSIEAIGKIAAAPPKQATKSELQTTSFCIYCMTVSLSQQGAGLGAAWGEELAEKMLYDAGFNKVDKKYLEHDIMNTYYLMRK